MTIGRFAQVLLIGGAVGLVLISALAATNTVPGSSAGLSSTGITANTLKPSQCSALTLAAVVAGAGTITGGNASELVTGSGGVDTIDAGKGYDCLVGGAGNDALTGGQGTDVCIGGLGTDTFHASCETQIQ
jgi:Ca2+-binding RTX toxin-like protein